MSQDHIGLFFFWLPIESNTLMPMVSFFPCKDARIHFDFSLDTNGVAGSRALQNCPSMFRANGDNGTILSLEKRMFLNHSGSMSKEHAAFDR